MCGIWLYLYKKGKKSLAEYELYDAFMRIEKRGPERSILLKQSNYNLYIGFHRLSIMDPSIRGDQPFVIETSNTIIYTICNGEIYNFKELSRKYELNVHSRSDCEILPYLYQKIGINILAKELIGEFAFCICEIDKTTEEVKISICRDQAGIRPLFIAGNDNEIIITSELKGNPFIYNNQSNTKHIKQFPPRHCLQISSFDEILFDNTFYKAIEYRNITTLPITIYDMNDAKKMIKNTLIEAVRCRMITDRPLGCLLSGGLDSSLVASIASNFCKEHGTKLRTFSIGMDGSTDKYYAELVAKYIDSIHTHIELPEEQWLNTINEVVKVTETFDITTIRASTGQYLISKWISEHTDIKVVLIGDGSDELCAGYMYFHKAPSAEDLHYENIRLVSDIHMYDVLRADRGISSNGLEARVPFLDYRFIELYLSIDPNLRMPTKKLEKWLLREAFSGENYLPEECRLRPKEAFSDGVSSKERSWYSILQDYINKNITESELKDAQKYYNHCIPPSKEALYFRKQFEYNFGKNENIARLIPYFWLPKWVGQINEPSARILDVYNHI